MSSPSADDEHVDGSGGSEFVFNHESSSDRTTTRADGSDRTIVAARSDRTVRNAREPGTASHHVAPAESAAPHLLTASITDQALLSLTDLAPPASDRDGSSSIARDSNRADLTGVTTTGEVAQVFDDVERDAVGALFESALPNNDGARSRAGSFDSGYGAEQDGSSSWASGSVNVSVIDIPAFQAMFKAYLEDHAAALTAQGHNLETIVANTSGVRQGVQNADEHAAAKLAEVTQRLMEDIRNGFGRLTEHLEAALMGLADMLREDEEERQQALSQAAASSSQSAASSSSSSQSGSSSSSNERVDRATQTEGQESRENEDEDTRESRENEDEDTPTPFIGKGKGRAP